MIRAIDGTMIFHAVRPGRLPERGDDYQVMTAREMPTITLKNRLCDLGPVKCAECRLCEYGKEYSRRTAEASAEVMRDYEQEYPGLH